MIKDKERTSKTDLRVEERIKAILEILSDPKTGLVALNRKVDHQETGLPGINDKLDALLSDMYHVEACGCIS